MEKRNTNLNTIELGGRLLEDATTLLERTGMGGGRIDWRSSKACTLRSCWARKGISTGKRSMSSC